VVDEESPLIVTLVALVVISVPTRVEKLDTVDTCTRYSVAPEEADQLRVGDVEMLGLPLAGLNKAGAASGGGMVKSPRCNSKLGLPVPGFPTTPDVA